MGKIKKIRYDCFRINDGHNSSASLIIKGKLIVRYLKKDTQDKKPFWVSFESVKEVLKFAKIDIKDVDRIACSNILFFHICIKKLQNVNKRLLERTKRILVSKIN